MAKILLADDSQFMRKVLLDILTKNGHTDITEAADGNEAIAKFNELKPDLVLLDIIMPNADGMMVLKDIVPKGGKAIVVSAVGQDEMINQAKDLGALGYIVKPFEEKQVVAEVNKVLSGQPPTPPTPPTPETPVAEPQPEPQPQPQPDTQPTP